jgi:hypothetical protein
VRSERGRVRDRTKGETGFSLTPHSSLPLAGVLKKQGTALTKMTVLNTLHKNWLLSLISSPFGRDKGEGAGCENPFSTPC